MAGKRFKVEMNDLDLRKWVGWVGHPKYLFNKYGVVYSLERKQFLKPHLTKNKLRKGYLRYTLCENGNITKIEVHRLLALLFIPNPNKLPSVDHINRNTRDNRLCNLRWATLETQAQNRDNEQRYKWRKIYELKDGYYHIYPHTSLLERQGFKHARGVAEGVRTFEHHRIFSWQPPRKEPYVIALSSGPCAGKTDSLKYLEAKLKDYFNVVVVPETATLWLEYGVKDMSIFQPLIAILQYYNEEKAIELARKLNKIDGRESVVLCDRSYICQQAYCSEEDMINNLQLVGLSLNDVYTRYDVCIHMESYAGKNFVAEGRLETATEAVKLDKHTMNYTSRHPEFALIPSYDRMYIKKKVLLSTIIRKINKVRSFGEKS